MTVYFSVHGLSEVTAGLTRMGAQLHEATAAATMAAAHLVQRNVMAEAPVVTGTLRRSVHTEGPFGTMARVGPATVYARRVELGFTGADSLGRNYDQAANPYTQRGYEASLDEIGEIYRRAWRAALGL